MCFKVGEIKVAKRDMQVWKLFINDGKGLITSYQRKPFVLCSQAENVYHSDGGFSSFKYKKDACQKARFYRGHGSGEDVVVRMFIPKGARYGEGNFYGPCYRSERLIGSKQRGKK